MSEEWRAVVGIDGYEVSNLGGIRSLDRIKVYQRRDHHTGRMLTVERTRRGRVLRAGVMQSGHLFVVLGRGNGRTVHTLVLEAFVGPKTDGTECCHNDGNPANNRVENLRWDTRASNIADYRRMKKLAQEATI